MQHFVFFFRGVGRVGRAGGGGGVMEEGWEIRLLP